MSKHEVKTINKIFYFCQLAFATFTSSYAACNLILFLLEIYLEGNRFIIKIGIMNDVKNFLSVVGAIFGL